ncbi:hypothetical protein VB773_13300 [Haloarculaceae archaeon H-GB2-1]|nr:hypothetical protein [Haloarculaceae archaeon H-GB2-1]
MSPRRRPLAVTVAPVAAAEGVVVGRPEIELYAPDNRVVGGETVSLEVFLSNAGEITRGGPAQYQDRVTTARNVRLDVLTDQLPDEIADDVEVLTGSVPVGTVPQGTAGPFPIRLEIDEDIEPGTYDIPVEVTYDYTWFVEYSDLTEPEFSDSSQQETKQLTIVVRDRPRFEVSSSGRVVTAGDQTRREFSVTNVGTEPAANATLTLASEQSPLSLGDGPEGGTATVTLGDLAPGNSTSAVVRVGAPETLPPGAYLLSASVEYRTEAGIVANSTPITVSVPVGAEQDFAVTNVTDTLQVGETGRIDGTIVNTGGQTVSNAVVVFPRTPRGSGPARERTPSAHWHPATPHRSSSSWTSQTRRPTGRACSRSRCGIATRTTRFGSAAPSTRRSPSTRSRPSWCGPSPVTSRSPVAGRSQARSSTPGIER